MTDMTEAPTRRVQGAQAGHSLGLQAILAVLVLGLAVAVRLVAPIDANIDWLVTVALHLLDGDRLYVDIVETNPPMAIWVHIPAVLMERWTGLAAEPVFAAMVLMAATASAAVFCANLRPLGLGRRTDLPLLLGILTVAPLTAFAEREHLALILTLPLIGASAIRASGRTPTVGHWVAAGLLAGMAAMIKPQFAFAVVAVTLFQAAKRRSVLAILTPEAVLAGGTTLLYAGAVMRFVPAYVSDVMPLLLDLYRPLGNPLLVLTRAPKTYEWGVALLALALAQRERIFLPHTGAIVAASIGFFIAYIDQGRGWPYHSLPMVSLMLFAVANALPEPLASGEPVRRVAGLTAVIAALMPFAYFSYFTYPTDVVTAAIRAAVPAPSITSISFDLTPGHPITTDTGGRWIGTYSSRWITSMANRLKARTSDPALIARYDRWLDHDRRTANQELMKRPDIVLVGIGPADWMGWISADAETRRLFADYRFLIRQPIPEADQRRFEGIEAWIRADLVAPK